MRRSKDQLCPGHCRYCMSIETDDMEFHAVNIKAKDIIYCCKFEEFKMIGIGRCEEKRDWI